MGCRPFRLSQWRLQPYAEGLFETGTVKAFTGSSWHCIIISRVLQQNLPMSKLFQFSSVAQSCPTLCDPMNHTARQASLSITNSRSSLRPTSIESVMPSSHLILCHPLLLLPPIPPSIRVFSNESTLHMRWPKYWSFSFSIIPPKKSRG